MKSPGTVSNEASYLFHNDAPYVIGNKKERAFFINLCIVIKIPAKQRLFNAHDSYVRELMK